MQSTHEILNFLVATLKQAKKGGGLFLEIGFVYPTM